MNNAIRLPVRSWWFRIRSRSLGVGTALAMLLLAGIGRAELSEPDNVLFGTLTLDDQPVSADRTDVVIEARRALNGPVIARYRMGSEPRFGNFYSLRLKLETAPVSGDPDASQLGDSLVIVVLDASGIRGETTFVFMDRGRAIRVDFGSAVTDADGNGLPDLWEVTYLGATGQNPDVDHDLDGASTRDEYVAGTHPSDSEDVFKVESILVGAQSFVSLFARRAEGPGYESLTRLYSLESTTNLLVSPWTMLPAFTDLPGDNALLNYEVTGAAKPVFYRAKISLEPR